MSQKDLYLTELILNISRFLEDSVSTQSTQVLSTLPDNCEISQEITGAYRACTAISGNADTLCTFAKHYSKFEINTLNDIAKEVLMDFLNLHNGLFTVNLSASKDMECSLLPPSVSLDQPADSQGTIYLMPVQFEYGVINFILYEKK